MRPKTFKAWNGLSDVLHRVPGFARGARQAPLSLVSLALGPGILGHLRLFGNQIPRLTITCPTTVDLPKSTPGSSTISVREQQLLNRTSSASAHGEPLSKDDFDPMLWYAE